MNFEELEDCYLKPGDFHLALTPTLIKTVLGSCITVTMYSPRTGIGAACHALLPTCREEREQPCPPGTCQNTFRFVECVIPEMIRQLQGQGLSVTELEVKLFGGADMMMAGLATHQRVGRSNEQMAKRLLTKLGMTIKSSDTGGMVGRKLMFNTATGDVWIKRLNKSC